MFRGVQVDDKLYAYLKNLAGHHRPLCLFRDNGEFTEVFSGSVFKFVLPVGLFADLRVRDRGTVFPRLRDAAKMRGVNLSTNTLPSLYPNQRIVVDEVLAARDQMLAAGRPVYITLHLACGFGKTLTACHLIATHGRRTVVCVPNRMLIPQWRAAVAELRVPFAVSHDGAASLLRSGELERAMVAIVVSRHFANDDFCRAVSRQFDVLVLDESHTYNLMNNTAVTRFLAKYPPPTCYFLTATPRLANRIYCNRVVNVSVISKLLKVVRVIDAFFEPFSTPRIRNMARSLDSPQNKYHVFTEKILSEDVHRNRLIVDTVARAFENGVSQRILVLTKLRNHMVDLHTALAARLGAEKVCLGDAKNKKTPEIARALRNCDRFVFVSTVFFSGTGLDLPNLDALAVAAAVLNKMAMEQIIGRVCRESHANARTLYVFPNSSVRAIRDIVSVFAQRLVALATDSLGFVLEQTAAGVKTDEPALYSAISGRDLAAG
ncbi:DNA helicase-like protein [Seal parapoxvirus]|uniref:DNA helicase-like protein n=1 Tax=Seal parapoxvirus TaxID=187984 RepID=A0A1Z3GCR6_9POXV|nr:DNA helicase-like protein [Seal parapoxvirus]ASC55551.1 DNA helicase-like protein [Seal parapoxvirus]